MKRYNKKAEDAMKKFLLIALLYSFSLYAMEESNLNIIRAIQKQSLRKVKAITQQPYFDINQEILFGSHQTTPLYQATIQAAHAFRFWDDRIKLFNQIVAANTDYQEDLIDAVLKKIEDKIETSCAILTHLLEKKADPQRIVDNTNPLLVAVTLCQVTPQVVSILLQYGASPNSLSSEIQHRHSIVINNHTYRTTRFPLHNAVKRNHQILVRTLLKYKAPVNQSNTHGKTPLDCICAADKQHRKVLRDMLLEAGALLNIKKQTAQLRSELNSDTPDLFAIKLLIENKADVNYHTTKEDGQDLQQPSYPLLQALDRLLSNNKEYFLASPSNEDLKKHLDASSISWHNVLCYLIKHKAELDGIPNHYNRFLGITEKNCCSVKIIQPLLLHNANPNVLYHANPNDGLSIFNPLTAAINNLAWSDVIQLLLDYNADPHQLDGYGNNAFDCSYRFPAQSYKQLLDKHTSKMKESEPYQIKIDQEIVEQQSRKLMIAIDAIRPTFLWFKNDTKEFIDDQYQKIQDAIQDGADVNYLFDDNWQLKSATPLAAVIRNLLSYEYYRQTVRHQNDNFYHQYTYPTEILESILNLLITNKADVNGRANQPIPLLVATNNPFCTPEIVTQLLLNNANPNMQDTQEDAKHKYRPLTAAISNNVKESEVVGLLLLAQADPQLQDGHNKNAFDYAQESKNDEYTRLLR